MSYQPDHEFCLITFEEQENVQEHKPKNKGFWASLFPSPEDKAGMEKQKVAEDRNRIRIDQAQRAISAAKSDGYTPVYSTSQKGEVTILAVKGGKGKWKSVSADKIAAGPYTTKTRTTVSNIIGKKMNPSETDSWKDVEKLAKKPKTDNQGGNRGGSGNRNRSGNRNNNRSGNRRDNYDRNNRSDNKETETDNSD